MPMKRILINARLVIVKGYAQQILCLLILIFGGLRVYSQAPLYDLSFKILPETRRLEVTGTIRLPAVTFDLDSIELSLSELMNDFRV